MALSFTLILQLRVSGLSAVGSLLTPFLALRGQITAHLKPSTVHPATDPAIVPKEEAGGLESEALGTGGPRLSLVGSPAPAHHPSPWAWGVGEGGRAWPKL